MLNKVKENFAPKPLLSPVSASQTFDSKEHALMQQFEDMADYKDALEAQRDAGMSNDNMITNQMVREGKLPKSRAEIYPQQGYSEPTNVQPQGQVMGAQSYEAGQPRNPLWDTWQKTNPKGFEELLSGAQLAAAKHGVPAELLMDISGLETSGGQILNQMSAPVGQGYFQFEPATLRGLKSDIDPYSATESADLAASLIKNKQLSRWGTPQSKNPLNKNWGTLDNPNNKNGSLMQWYGADELNPYLSDKYQIE